MPRTGRGGARSGTPGQTYSNRTDMNQPVRVAPSSQYGQGAQQEAAQRAFPLPNNTALPAQGGPPPQQAPVPQGPPPGGLGGLDAPTDRPGEHVSTGLPVGPGAGPEVLSQFATQDDTGIQLRAMYRRFPNQDLADLIQVYEAGNRG